MAAKFEINFKELMNGICNSRGMDTSADVRNFPDYCTLSNKKIGAIVSASVEELVNDLTIKEMEEFFEHASDYLQYVEDVPFIDRMQKKMSDIPARKSTSRRVL